MRPGRTAFSLVEVIIAVAILFIGLFGVIRVFPVGLRASQRSELVSRATLLAQRTLEPLKLKTWSELAEGETTDAADPFTITPSVDQPLVEGLADPSRLKRVVVTVGWTQEGRARSLTMVTYVRRPTP